MCLSSPHPAYKLHSIATILIIFIRYAFQYLHGSCCRHTNRHSDSTCTCTLTPFPIYRCLATLLLRSFSISIVILSKTLPRAAFRIMKASNLSKNSWNTLHTIQLSNFRRSPANMFLILSGCTLRSRPSLPNSWKSLRSILSINLEHVACRELEESRGGNGGRKI